MTKTKMVIFVAFVLALGAGGAVGVLAARNVQRPEAGRSWFRDELQLTQAQQTQMHEIWSAAYTTKALEFAQEFRALQRQHDDALAALLNSDQKTRYEQINADYAAGVKELIKRCEQAFDDVANQARQLLNESQRPKFDAMMQKMKAQHANGQDWLAFLPGIRTPATQPAETK